MISAELILGSLDYHEMVLAFPAHVANSARCLIGTGKLPLFLGFMAIPVKRFSSSESCGGVWILHPHRFITKRCSRPAIYYFSCTSLGCCERPPLPCGMPLQLYLQNFPPVKTNLISSCSSNLLSVTAWGFSFIQKFIAPSCWGLHLLLVFIAHMWYPPPRRCSVKCSLNKCFDGKTGGTQLEAFCLNTVHSTTNHHALNSPMSFSRSLIASKSYYKEKIMKGKMGMMTKRFHVGQGEARNRTG